MTSSRSLNNLDSVKMARYHHGNLKAALVEAAIELVAEKGSSGLTLRAVGRRVGVSRSAAYHHFTNKEQLLRAVALEGFRRLDERLAGMAGSASERAGALSLQRFSLEYVRFAVTHPTLFRIMHHTADGVPTEASSWPDAFASHSELWTGVAGSPRKGLVAWCTMYGLAVLWIDGPMKARAEDRTVATLVTTAVDALR